MRKIEIHSTNGDTFLFSGKENVSMPPKCYDIRCSICTGQLDPAYVYIIRKLKKAGLLKTEYPFLCCCCWKAIKNITIGDNTDILCFFCKKSHFIRVISRYGWVKYVCNYCNRVLSSENIIELGILNGV